MKLQRKVSYEQNACRSKVVMYTNITKKKLILKY